MKRGQFAAFVLPSVVTMAGLLVVPLVLTIIWSFQSITYGKAGHWIGFGNFTAAFDSGRFRGDLIFTILLTAVVVTAEIIVGYGIALLLNQVARGRSVLLALILVPFVVPAVLGATVFSWLFSSSFGDVANWVLSGVGVHVNWLVSTTPARGVVALEMVWHDLAFPVLVFLAGLQMLPAEHFEAASVDGATWLQKQRWIVIPGLRRLFVFVALISVMDSLRIFDAIQMITPAATTTGTESIMVYVYDVALNDTQQLGMGSAISLLTMVMTFVVLLPLLWRTYREMRTA